MIKSFGYLVIIFIPLGSQGTGKRADSIGLKELEGFTCIIPYPYFQLAVVFETAYINLSGWPGKFPLTEFLLQHFFFGIAGTGHS
jgi:hypothetical protein